MKKILLFSTSNEGTIAKCANNILKSLLERDDVEVKSIILYKDNGGENIISDSEFCLNRIDNPTQNISLSYKIKWLKDIKVKYRPDITVSTQDAASLISVLSGGDDYKIGIFHAPHQQANDRSIFYYLKILLSYYIIFPFLDKLFCVSKEVKQSFRSIPTIKKSKVKVVYNIHDIEKIQQLSQEPLSLEEKKIFKRQTILYCGRLDENKAPQRILDAFIGLKRKDINLLFIGPDPFSMWSTLEKTIIDSGVSNSVKYLGSQSNPYKFMRNASLLVSSSYSEGLPGVVIESLILGRPVVTTNSSRGVWEILSVDDKYDKMTDTNIYCSCGAITPNLSFYNKQLYGKDVDLLTEALEHELKKQRVDKFIFQDNIKSKNVIDKFINPCLI